MLLRHALAIVPLITCVSLSASTQEVRGRVLAPGSAVPVAGVIVALVDAKGVMVDRALTSEGGIFRLRADRPDVYQLRALRIGFRPSLTAAFSLARGEVADRSIELDGRAIMLTAVNVAADRTCDVRPDSSSSAFDAWEEARKALAAAVLTRGRRYTMEVAHYERRVSVRTGAVVWEHEDEARGATDRPFVSVPIAHLDSAGYVQVTPDVITYLAPDEEVLLSEQFASTHCLRRADGVNAEEVALAFEPTEERTRSDIRGTLVLDRATGALRRLEFTYASVSSEVQRERAGGRIFFRSLPAGGWIVDRWTMRYPVFERVMTQQPARGTDIRSAVLRRMESLALREMHETGGEVTEVMRGDSVLWQLDRPALTGSIRDESGVAVAGATVTIPTLGRRAETDAGGRFAIDKVRRGRRTLTVTTPLLDSLGLAPLAREADSRTTDAIRLSIPDREALFATACGLPADEARKVGFIRGTTRGEHGERIGGVRIVARWIEPRGATLDPRSLGVTRTLETVSSAAGEYSLCGVRLDQLITFNLSLAGAPAGERTGRVPLESRVLLLELPLVPRPGSARREAYGVRRSRTV